MTDLLLIDYCKHRWRTLATSESMDYDKCSKCTMKRVVKSLRRKEVMPSINIHPEGRGE